MSDPSSALFRRMIAPGRDFQGPLRDEGRVPPLSRRARGLGKGGTSEGRRTRATLEPGEAGRPRRRRDVLGFTIIELMIVVAILGILTAIALPGFMSFVRRSRTAEVPPNLQAMFSSAASYYALELSDRGVGAAAVTNCISGPAESAWTPRANKHSFRPVNGPGFDTIGFSIADPIYYNYQLDTFGLPSTCQMPSQNPATYALRAIGDLDGDTNLSTFEVSVGTSIENALYRGVGIWSKDDME